MITAGGAWDRATYGPLRLLGVGRVPAARVDRQRRFAPSEPQR